MSHNIQLLDCTLRDGGYVNDWKFGKNNLISIFKRLVNANVDIIEVGFLDQRRPFDIERSIMPNTACVEHLWKDCKKNNSIIVGMIDYGTCGIENIQPCTESYLDGIRVIFKKHLMHEAMEFCHQLKQLGYKVFSQMVSITSYNEDEVIELASLVNKIKPYAVSIVDTYGLLKPNEVLYYYEILDKNISSEIKIGFHAHNNFQLAYANTLAFLERKTTRDVIVDGTLYGMGKSAGNAPIELIGMYLNTEFEKNYKIGSMLECIEESILNFYMVHPWGYKTFFYLCAKNDCHPNYLMFFQNKENLSISKLDNLLSKIEPKEKKLLYDQDIAEHIYDEYLKENDLEAVSIRRLCEDISDKELLIIGPGKNINLQKEVVKSFIEEKTPYVISINYIPKDIEVDCVFVTNQKRYHDMLMDSRLKKIKILATTNVESFEGDFDFVINREPLLEMKDSIKDNSLLMIIKLIIRMECKKINCAGFDGYSEDADNYCNPSMEYSFVKKEAAHLNAYMKKRISDFREKLKINFITYSAYDMDEDINGAMI